MKKNILHTIQALTVSEKKRFWVLIVPDVILSVLDIGFMAALVWLAGIYTGSNKLSLLNKGIDIAPDSLLPIFIFLLLFIGKNVFAVAVLKRQFQFIYEVALRISHDNLQDYFLSDYTDYVQVDSAVYVRKVSQEPIEFCYYVLRSLQQMISQVVLIALAIGAVLVYNPSVFLLLLAVLTPPVVFCTILMKKKINGSKMLVKKNSERSLQHLYEALAGFVEGNLYNAKSFFVNRFIHHQQSMNAALAEQQSIQSMPSRFIEVFAVAGFFALVLFNKYFYGTTHVPVVTLGAFMAAAYKVIPGIVKILNSAGQMKAYEFAIHPLRNKKSIVENSGVVADKIQTVQFKGVYFSYHSSSVLYDFNMIIRSGDMVGICGLSGKGKTTVMHLLLGFLSPSSGDILINNEYTTALQRQQLANKIAYVKQHPFLFSDSILNNITFGETVREFDMVDDVLTVAGMQQIASGIGEAETTYIADSGKNLSGGQRQRITIARALYKKADMIILDEPFKELDEASEIEMLKYFQSLASEGRIVVLITHNKKSLQYCNKTIEIG